MNPLERFCVTLFLLVTAIALAACGDRVVLLECPLGTMPEGAVCVPYEPDFDSFVSPPLDGVDDVTEPGDVLEQETMRGPADSEGDGRAGVTDVGSSSGGVGTACLKAADCGMGWSCLNWPGGYCTILDCSQSSCPAGSVCTSVSGGNLACLRTCADDNDCPSPEDQACKQEMSTVSGDLVKV